MYNCIGVNELDEGVKNLTLFLNEVSIATLSCNMDMSEEPLLQNTRITPSTIIDRGNLKIGIIGYVSPNASVLSEVGRIKFKDEIECIQAEAKKLKAKGVKIIIGLGNSEYEKDLEIAETVEEIDVIVGGRSRTFLYTGVPPDIEIPENSYPTLIRQVSGRHVPVVQAYYATKYLGFLEVSFDDNGEVSSSFGNPILLDSSVEKNRETTAELSKWRPAYDALAKERLGETRVILNGSCSFHECNLGNLITDALLDYAVRNLEKRHWTEAAIAIYQGGGTIDSINTKNGVITSWDLLLTIPFFGKVSVFTITGEHLLAALEWSVTRYDFRNARKEFLQFSGLHVVYDLRRRIGTRVVSATARCANCQVPSYQPINPICMYEIVTSSFLAKGGDFYDMFRDHKKACRTFKF